MGEGLGLTAFGGSIHRDRACANSRTIRGRRQRRPRPPALLEHGLRFGQRRVTNRRNSRNRMLRCAKMPGQSWL
jgi:hypothetical protein